MEEKKQPFKAIVIAMAVLAVCIFVGILVYYIVTKKDNKSTGSVQNKATETVIKTSEVGTVTVPVATDPLPSPPAPKAVR